MSDVLSKDAGHRSGSLLKIHSSTGVFQTFCQEKPATWFLHKRNIGRKWFKVIVPATTSRRDIKISLSVGLHAENFNIVSNNHGRAQK